MRRLAFAAATIAALFGAVALSGVALPVPARGASTQQGRTIQVLGEGTVETVPDTARFEFGVATQASTAKQALAANADTAQKVVGALKAIGVAAGDIQTRQVSLSPHENPPGMEITGYTAENTVSATVRDLSAAGAIVDAAVAAGANQVSGPSLTASGQAALERRALTAAFDNAQAKAKALAEQAGGSLGQALQITEGSPQPGPVRAAPSGAVGTTPVQPGTLKVQAQVTVTFALR